MPSEQSLKLAREFAKGIITLMVQCRYISLSIAGSAFFEAEDHLTTQTAALLDQREAKVRQEQHEVTAELCAQNCMVQLTTICREDEAETAYSVCIGVRDYQGPDQRIAAAPPTTKGDTDVE